MTLDQIISRGFTYLYSLWSKESISSIEKILDLPYIAFFGASNAGKSSLISNICRTKNLAFSSKTPGKTKEIIIFTPNHSFFHKKAFLVDFPGYGYAKVANSTLSQWEAIPEFVYQANIIKSYILIPVEKPLQEHDLMLMDMLEYKTFAIVLTKCDKVPFDEVKEKQEAIRKQLAHCSNFTGQVFLFSTKKVKNKENLEISQEIFDILKNHINRISN